MKKTNIFKIGYELGGYNKYSNIYGYTFESDPNIARKVAAALYCAMRGKLHPNTDKMRIDVGGTNIKFGVFASNNKKLIDKLDPSDKKKKL